MVLPLMAAAAGPQALAGLSSLAGGIIGSRSAAAARRAQQAATTAAIAGQTEARNTNVNRLQPYADIGQVGLNGLRTIGTKPLSAEDIYSDPGYAFARTEGMRGIEGTQAARGGLYSGAALKELTDFNSGNANRFFNDAFQRQRTSANDAYTHAMGMTGVGEQAVGGQNQASTHFADTAGQYITGQGNADAASRLAQGRIWQDTLNNIGGMGMGGGMGGGAGGGIPNIPIPWQAPQFSPGAGMPTYRDGGPVDLVLDSDGRYVPRVGSRSPRPSAGTGGAMSREAILARLSGPAPAPAVAASAPPMLPANPVTNPGAILADQERRAMGYACGGAVHGRMDMNMGGPVMGPGGPRDDAIPAWLSNGEYVVPAAQVRRAGGPNALRRVVQQAQHGR